MINFFRKKKNKNKDADIELKYDKEMICDRSLDADALMQKVETSFTRDRVDSKHLDDNSSNRKNSLDQVHSQKTESSDEESKKTNENAVYEKPWISRQSY